MDLASYYEYVKKTGKLRTTEHARRWSNGVLNTLGTVLDRKTKKALVKALPAELAESLGGVFWLLHFPNTNMSGIEFQNRVSRRSGNSDPEFARHPTVAVFGGVKQIIDPTLSQQVADKLPPEIKQLWQEA